MGIERELAIRMKRAEIDIEDQINQLEDMLIALRIAVHRHDSSSVSSSLRELANGVLHTARAVHIYNGLANLAKKVFWFL